MALMFTTRPYWRQDPADPFRFEYTRGAAGAVVEIPDDNDAANSDSPLLSNAPFERVLNDVLYAETLWLFSTATMSPPVLELYGEAMGEVARACAAVEAAENK